jgi:hypothetical protein
MRKRIIDRPLQDRAADDWLNLEFLARVETTSEDPAHPIESALIPGAGSGWRAAQSGTQIIRIVFDRALKLRRLFLVFQEEEQARTQEFALHWLAEGEKRFRPIVRQQYNFSPPGTMREIEDYRVDLDRLMALELTIIPDVSRGSACASLKQLLLA